MDDPALRQVGDDLRRKLDADLATFRADKIDTSLYAILADKEFKRRNRLQQHELEEQVRWMKFTTVFSLAATLVGAVAGALLAIWVRD